MRADRDPQEVASTSFVFFLGFPSSFSLIFRAQRRSTLMNFDNIIFCAPVTSVPGRRDQYLQISSLSEASLHHHKLLILAGSSDHVTHDYSYCRKFLICVEPKCRSLSCRMGRLGG